MGSFKGHNEASVLNDWLAFVHGLVLCKSFAADSIRIPRFGHRFRRACKGVITNKYIMSNQQKLVETDITNIAKVYYIVEDRNDMYNDATQIVSS